MNNEKNEKTLRPIHMFACPYCGHTFLSLDYRKIYNRVTHSFRLEDDCLLCGCVIRIEEE